MITLQIEDKRVETIFLNEFHSNKERFFEFIKNSYEKTKQSDIQKNSDIDLMYAQESVMARAWDNEQDKVWDEL